jgi:ABC-type multidrug transport system ATPase subunit
VDALIVTGLTRTFGNLLIFDEISFTVRPGQVAVVLGPNGSGKTTLLRCVVGADRADSGEVRLNGRRLDETDPWMRSVVAAALDDIDFFPDLSVAEHLHLLAYAHGSPPGGDPAGGRSADGDPARGGATDPVEDVLVELGLEPARDQLPATLSSGQRRRLALASCFVRPRRLLVLDEPEQRLDVRGRGWLADRLRREKVAGTSVLMASHDQELIDAVADVRIEIGA